ncbi:SprT family zinc-dependent metalloprotease [Alteromonas sp. D210916BOD_24]|uniref:SprT family zinc-dependent metalloprotease n=1 Tax=Alteromonas sp. D210916BOD_24 TaxID=3157618 RepID=UPI00399C8CB9
MIATYDLTEYQRHAITSAVEACYDKADAFFGQAFPRPTVTYRRSGRNAGTAFLQQNRINFHPTLYKENEKIFLENVIPHEVSHLLVWLLYGKVKPHGAEWQSVMVKVFNCRPDTTHQFDIRRAANTFRYTCHCDSYELSTRRHNNVLKGMQYRCKRCRHPLKHQTQ